MSLSALPVPRPSACPGLLRIVPALDGGICRVKLAGGQLSSAQARAIAEAATAYASGVLELTNRSNLQIRGVRPEYESALIQRLLAAGLGPSRMEADDVRNLLLSPAAGLDPAALLDTQPLGTQLLRLLEDSPELHQLSAKFALQLDGGEALAMRKHPHDLWLRVLSGQPAYLAFGLAGCPADAPLAAVPLEQALPLVEAILRLFLHLASPEQSRMRHLLATVPVSSFLAQLQARLAFPLHYDLPEMQPLAESSHSVPLGRWPQRQADQHMLIAGARLGRINAQQLRALAELVERYGSARLRLTPWQGLLVPDIPQPHSGLLMEALRALGLLTDANEPLSQLIACTGSAACIKGLADTKADALRLAERLRFCAMRPQVHLSGCERSCAAAHIADFTLLAQADGRYDLYQSAPDAAGFGRRLASSLCIEHAGEWFAALPAAGVSHA